jgi:hypothetical protein
MQVIFETISGGSAMKNLSDFVLRVLVLKLLPKSAVLIGILLLLTSCAQLGPELVKAGRNDYNIVLQQTEDEEVILNLVRVRYGDRPLFFDVSSVSTSFTWSQNAAASGTLFEYGGSDVQRNNLSVRGDLQYTERPTITYTPLGGKDFVKSVLTPADLDTLILLSNSGWSIERLLRLMANRMNGLPNAPRASGPTPGDKPVYQEFTQAAKLMRQLQIKGMLRLGYQKIENTDVPVIVIDEGAGGYKETRKLKELLGLAIEKNTFIVDTRGDRPRSESVGIDLRSLLATFFFASHGVEVPTDDLAMGRAMTTKDQSGKPFDWSLVVGDLVSIRSQTKKPSNAQVAIKYRGAWFYIDDSDLNTKYSFLLLDQLAALLGGKVEKAGPLLTLPVSAP